MKKIDQVKEKKLKAEVNETLEKSRLLLEDGKWTLEQIMKLVHQYSDEELDKMSLEDRKKLYSQLVTMMNRMRINAEELLKVDMKELELRKRTNELYGEEVLPIRPPIKLPTFTLKDLGIDDAGEEWKHS